ALAIDRVGIDAVTIGLPVQGDGRWRSFHFGAELDRIDPSGVRTDQLNCHGQTEENCTYYLFHRNEVAGFPGARESLGLSFCCRRVLQRSCRWSHYTVSEIVKLL